MSIARWTEITVDLVTVPFDPRPPDPLRDELERFRLLFPLLADRLVQALDLASHTETKRNDRALFDVGKVLVGRDVRNRVQVSDAELRELLDRHQAGEHGLTGSGKNSAAIADGEGLIESRFDIFTEPYQKEFHSRSTYGPSPSHVPPLVRRPGDCLIIATMIRHGESETVVTVHRA